MISQTQAIRSKAALDRMFAQSENDKNKKPRMPQANWTDKQKECLLDLLLEAKKKGEIGQDNSIKKAVWTAINTAFNNQFHVNYDKAQLQTCLQNMKKKYEAFVKIKDTSGLGWNDELGYPECDEEVWEEYIRHDKDAKEFRHKPLVHFELLDEYFSGTLATGEHASSAGKLGHKPKAFSSRILRDEDDDDDSFPAPSKQSTLSEDSPVELVKTRMVEGNILEIFKDHPDKQAILGIGSSNNSSSNNNISSRTGKPLVYTCNTPGAPRPPPKQPPRRQPETPVPNVQTRMVSALERLVASPNKTKDQIDDEIVNAALRKLKEFLQDSHKTPRHRAHLTTLMHDVKKAKMLLSMEELEMAEAWFDELCEDYDIKGEMKLAQRYENKRKLQDMRVGINYGYNNPNNIGFSEEPNDDDEL